jgi:hypothetical protein
MGDSMFTYDKKARTAELRSKLEAMQAKQSLALPASTTFHEVFSSAITSALRSKRVSAEHSSTLQFTWVAMCAGNQCKFVQDYRNLHVHTHSLSWYDVACRLWEGTSSPGLAGRCTTATPHPTNH